MGKKRVNIVLNEDVHKEAVIFAARGGWDFSEFVNLMLETFLYSEDKEVFEAMLKGMLATEVRRHGFAIEKDALQLKGEQLHREKSKKRKK